MNSKRSFTLAGHRTSIALEPDFWQALETMAGSRNIALAALVAEIDLQRQSTNLASACRLAALRHYQDTHAITPPRSAQNRV